MSIVLLQKSTSFYSKWNFRFSEYWANYLWESLFALRRVLCRCQLGSYILRAGFRRLQTALWRRRWVKIDKQSIPFVHVGRGPSSLHEMISSIRTHRSRRLSTSSARPRCQCRSLCDGGDFLWKFRRNSKAKSNMGVFHEVSQ